VTRQRLVEIREVVVDEVWKRLRWVHARSWSALCALSLGALIPPMVQ
jgi:hypothetical protein